VPTVCSAPANAIPAEPNHDRPQTGFTYRPLPVCDATSTVEFLPGYYDDAVGLSAMMSGVGPCAGKTFHFQANATAPGFYYFDFHNSEGGGGLPSGPDVWTINDKDVQVVAGTPQGWTASPFTAPTIPGACVSPLTATSNNGVQFAFGGDSRFVVNAGQVELCGQYYADKPPITVYGITAGNDPAPVTATLGTNGSGSTPSGRVPFSPFSALTATDGTAAAASLDGTGGDSTASVAVQDFSTASLPAGAYLRSAHLRIVHRETVQSGELESLRATAVVDTSGSPVTVGPVSLTTSPSWRTDTVPVPVSALERKAHAGTPVLSRAQIDAAVKKVQPASKPQNKVKVEIDSVHLVLSYKPPAVRAQTTSIAGAANCVGTAPYTDSLNCALITTDGRQSRLYIQGTTYAPKAALDISLTNVSSQVFRSGLVARSLRITVTASSSYSGPVIEVPDDSPGRASAPLGVHFTAYVCPEGVSCSGEPPGSGWSVAGQAQAEYADAAATPVAGSRTVTVQAWHIPQ